MDRASSSRAALVCLVVLALLAGPAAGVAAAELASEPTAGFEGLIDDAVNETEDTVDEVEDTVTESESDSGESDGDTEESEEGTTDGEEDSDGQDGSEEDDGDAVGDSSGDEDDGTEGSTGDGDDILRDAVDDVEGTVEETTEVVDDGETLDGATDDVEDATEETVENAEDSVEDISEDTESSVEDTGSTVEETADSVGGATDETVDGVSGTIENTTDGVEGTVNESVNNTSTATVDLVDGTVSDGEDPLDGLVTTVETTTDTLDSAVTGTLDTTEGTIGDTTATLGDTTTILTEPVEETLILVEGSDGGQVDDGDGGPTDPTSSPAKDDESSTAPPTSNAEDMDSGEEQDDENDEGAVGFATVDPGIDPLTIGGVPTDLRTVVGVLIVSSVGALVGSLTAGGMSSALGLSTALTLPAGQISLAHLLKALVTAPGKFIGSLFRYSRYDDSDPLENDRRRAIYETITENPGIYLSELEVESGVSLSTARHHLRILEGERCIKTEKRRGKRRFFPVDSDDLELTAALADPAICPLLETLAEMGEARNAQLADALDRKPSTISHHLTSLEEEGLVVRERDGRATANRLSPSVARAMNESAGIGGEDRRNYEAVASGD